MKKFWLIFISLSMIACSGNEETIEETNQTIQTPTDSVSIAPAFAEFATYVKSLEPALENIDSAFAKYELLKINFTQEEKDSAFFIVKSFMHSFDVLDEEQEDYTEKNYEQMEKKYSAVGLEIWSEEGWMYLMPDIKFLEKKFKKDISVELDDYIDVLKKIFRQTTNDAGLSVEWTELSEMIISCEDYLIENQDSKYVDDVFNNYIELMNLMLWGLANTPIIDYSTGENNKQLNAEVSEVYQKIIADNKHKTGKIIADHLEFLESKNFEYEYEEIQYLTEAEAKMYLGIE